MSRLPSIARRIHSTMHATLTLSTIAAPPPCGVGTLCELSTSRRRRNIEPPACERHASQQAGQHGRSKPGGHRD